MSPDVFVLAAPLPKVHATWTCTRVFCLSVPKMMVIISYHIIGQRTSFVEGIVKEGGRGRGRDNERVIYQGTYEWYEHVLSSVFGIAETSQHETNTWYKANLILDSKIGFVLRTCYFHTESNSYHMIPCTNCSYIRACDTLIPFARGTGWVTLSAVAWKRTGSPVRHEFRAEAWKMKKYMHKCKNRLVIIVRTKWSLWFRPECYLDFVRDIRTAKKYTRFNTRAPHERRFLQSSRLQ